MITLSYLTTTLTLPPDLYWSDENSWNAVEQTVERTITGAQIIQSGLKIQGRPITLEPEGDNSAWAQRSLVDAIRNIASVPGAVMTLILRGQSYDVMFRHHEGVAVEATPIVHMSDVQSSDFYKLTLRLMEV